MNAHDRVDVTGSRCHSTALPASDLSARRARDFVAAAFDDSPCHDPTVQERLALVTSELVTNAVVHTGTAVELRITIGRYSVYLEVLDGGSDRPIRRPPALSDLSGRGMILVDAMVDDWGVRDLDMGRGKMVWVRVDAA